MVMLIIIVVIQFFVYNFLFQKGLPSFVKFTPRKCKKKNQKKSDKTGIKLQNLGATTQAEWDWAPTSPNMVVMWLFRHCTLEFTREV